MRDLVVKQVLRLIAITAILYLAACQNMSLSNSGSWATAWGGDRYLSFQPKKIDQICGGNNTAWLEFVDHLGYVDGESAEVFSVACAELVLRVPGLLLEHHLAGEESAIRVMKKGLGRISIGKNFDKRYKHKDVISSIRTLYKNRLYTAPSSDHNDIIEFMDLLDNANN